MNQLLSVVKLARRAALAYPSLPHAGAVVGMALLTLAASVGCSSRLFRHTGAVNMGGGFDMTGDMTVNGEMQMGEVETAIRMTASQRTSPLSPIVVSGEVKRIDKIAVVDVDDLLVDHNIGGIGSMGENPVALFREKLERIRRDRHVKAVVLRINSPGGGVTASDIMCNELRRLKQERDVPIVACVMVVGTGGAYYLANHCDAIVAHPTSILGGVGVILNVYNLEDTMGQFNILGTPIKSGDKIDAGSPERPIEAEEMQMLQRIADSFHQRFLDQVTTKRPAAANHLPQWSDGSVMTGEEAQQIGLVDATGYLDDAIGLAMAEAGLNDGAPVVMYRRDNDPAYTAMDISPNRPAIPSLMPLHLPGLDRSHMPTFLYMWQADPALAAQAHR